MKRLLFLLLFLLIPFSVSANDTINPTNSDITLIANQTTYPNDTFTISLTPKTSTKKVMTTPTLGGKLYLFAEDDQGNVRTDLDINDNLAKKGHYLRSSGKEGVFLMSTNKLIGNVKIKASLKKPGNATLFSVYVSGKTTISLDKVTLLKASAFRSTKNKNKISIKSRTFKGFMAMNISILGKNMPAKVIAPPFDQAIKDNPIPVDEHGENKTTVDLIFYNDSAQSVDANLPVKIVSSNPDLSCELERDTTDQKGSIRLSLIGQVDDNDTLTIYLNDELVAKPIRLENYSAKPSSIEFTKNSKTYYIDGNPHTLDMPMLYKDGRSYLPLRAITNAINAKVFFEPKANVITIYHQNHIMTMTIGQPYYTIDSTTKTMDAKPFIKNGYTLVPVRFVATEFGYKANATATGITLMQKAR